MLTGRRPFDEKDPASLFAAQRDREVPTISERAPGVAVPEEPFPHVNKTAEFRQSQALED
jgi:hypothetical protein